MSNCVTILQHQLFEARLRLIVEIEKPVVDRAAIATLKAEIEQLKRKLAEVEMSTAQRD